MVIGDMVSFDMVCEVMVLIGCEVVLMQGENVVVGNYFIVNLKIGQVNLCVK